MYREYLSDQRLASESRRSARRIQAELQKPGFEVRLATALRYRPKRDVRDGRRQRWATFLRNPRESISAMDVLMVPTIRFKMLVVWLAVTHGRRDVLHFDVSEHPSASWVMAQVHEAFPAGPSIKFVIHDDDAIVPARVLETTERLSINPDPT